MNSIRAEARKFFAAAAKADLEQGISGVQKALEIRRKYSELLRLADWCTRAPPEFGRCRSCGHGMLEVIESYFSKISAELSFVEDECEVRYHKFIQENKVTKLSKEQDVKYKEQESGNLKKSAGETAQ